jgi:trimeric autotransporter adhesin
MLSRDDRRERKRKNRMMNSARVAIGCLLFSIAAAAQQYVISTYAGGAVPAIPAAAVAGSIGAPISLATDAAGNAYFSSPDLNSVLKLDPTGGLTRVAGNGTTGYSGDGGPATSARLRLNSGDSSTNSAGLAVDSAGNLFIADTGNHRIRRVSPDGVITTVAGSSSRGFSGDGGAATTAELNYPLGVAVDGRGNLFIVDTFNYRIRKVAANGIISTVAGGGTMPGASSDGGPATSAQLTTAWAVAADSAGNLFIVDFAYGYGPDLITLTRIRKVSPGGIITTVGQMDAWGVAVDGVGNLFVADAFGRVRKISPDGITSTVAGNRTFGFSGDGGPATSAQMNYPWAVAVDRAGNLFIADRLNYRIRKVSPAGTIITVAGDGTGHGIGPPNGGPATDGGPATSSQVSNPQGVAVDGLRNVFIADSGNNRIRKVSSAGIITTIAGNGTIGFSGDGGPATSAQVSAPVGVTVDAAGTVFFVDTGNGAGGRIRKVSPNGIITTVAGNGTPGFSGDGGPATAAALGSFAACNRICGGVAVDGAGNLFIADPGNSRVRQVSPSGIITTVAGNDVVGFSGDGGPAANAQLTYPVGVAVDGTGNLFIADYARVRKVYPSGIISTVAGSGTLEGSAADGAPATSAHLSYPYGLAVDAAGNLFFTDPGSNFFAGGDAGDFLADHRIRRVSPDGIITSVAGDGVAGYSGDGGPASIARLNGPSSLALDEAGNLYVADTGNQVVRVLRPTNRSVFIGGVVDAASQGPSPVSPGKIVAIYGAGIGASQLIQNQPSNGQLSTELGGTTVSFNGIAAPILYTSATQIAAIVPYAIAAATAQVTVTYLGEVSNVFAVTVSPSAPNFFTSSQTGAGQASALNVIDGTVNSAVNPVKIGEYISLYATGEGQTKPGGVDGKLAGSMGILPILRVGVTVGGIPATVQYAGSVPGQVAGVMQMNVQIPNGVQPGGYVPIVVRVGDGSSSPAVWIAVSN